MTAPKALRRRRRSRAGTDIPKDLAAWFAGEPRYLDGDPSRPDVGVPWPALVHPDYILLPERWNAWKVDHPNARPPAGYEWLDDQNDKRHNPRGPGAEAARYLIRMRGPALK